MLARPVIPIIFLSRKESVYFKKPVPVRILIRDLDLTSQAKDRIATGNRIFMSLYDTVLATAMIAAQDAARDRTLDLLVKG